MKKIKN